MDDDLKDLIENPRETERIELKEWVNLGDPIQKANLARHLGALANHGGGYLREAVLPERLLDLPPHVGVDDGIVFPLVEAALVVHLPGTGDVGQQPVKAVFREGPAAPLDAFPGDPAFRPPSPAVDRPCGVPISPTPTVLCRVPRCQPTCLPRSGSIHPGSRISPSRIQSLLRQVIPNRTRSRYLHGDPRLPMTPLMETAGNFTKFQLSVSQNC